MECARGGQAHLGPLRSFTMANSNYPNHTVLALAMHVYLRWRNAKRTPPRRPRRATPGTPGIRSERQQRWGRARAKAA